MEHLYLKYLFILERWWFTNTQSVIHKETKTHVIDPYDLSMYSIRFIEHLFSILIICKEEEVNSHLSSKLIFKSNSFEMFLKYDRNKCVSRKIYFIYLFVEIWVNRLSQLMFLKPIKPAGGFIELISWISDINSECILANAVRFL